MPITPFDENLDIIQALADEPNDDDGLTADELKGKFDEAGNLIKGYINDTLIPDVETAVEDSLAAAKGYADKVVVSIGAGDMAKAIYDPNHRETDIFAEIDGVVDDIGKNYFSKQETLLPATASIAGLTASAVPDNMLGALIPRYGVCTASAASTAKSVTLPNAGVFKLFAGVTISVQFTNASIATSPTLNVGGTGAKPFFSAMTGTYVKSHEMVSGMVCDLIYNGTNWLLLNPVSPKIQRLSYAGTGVFGATNPNTLTFPFRPQIVHIREAGIAGRGVSALVQGTTNTLVDSSVSRLIVTWSGNDVSWYNPSGAGHQLNDAGVSYVVVAIG